MTIDTKKMNYRDLIGEEVFQELFADLSNDGVLDASFEMEDGASFKLSVALEVSTNGMSAAGTKSGSRGYGVHWTVTEQALTSVAS